MRQLRPTFSVNDKLFENFLDRFSYLWIVKKEKKIYLDFVIDKLTNSIQNTISGDSFPTEVSRFTKADLKQVTKKNGWNFNWKQELDNNSREVYKLTINNNPNIIQGLISFTMKPDHIYMDEINFMRECLEISLHLHVRFHFNMDLMVSFLLPPKRNLLNTTRKLWEHTISEII